MSSQPERVALMLDIRNSSRNSFRVAPSLMQPILNPGFQSKPWAGISELLRSSFNIILFVQSQKISHELTVREDNRNETSQIAVRVLFFGAARDAVGQAEIVFSLTNPANAASAFDQVLDAFPALRRFGRSLLFAVNEEYARPDREVFAGDELAVFPSVSGGSEPDEKTRETVVGVSLRGHPELR